jgi:hypothetical protein
MGLFSRNGETRRRQLYSEQREQARNRSQSTRFIPLQPTERQKEERVQNLVTSLKRDSFAILGSILLIIAAGAYVVFGTNQFLVADVQVSDTQFIPKQSIEAATQDYLNRKTLGIIPHNRLPLLRQSGLEHAIREALGNPYAIEAIVIDKDYPQQINIRISERIPAVTWVTKESNGREHFYTVERNGTITEELPNFGAVKKELPRIHDQNRTILGTGWHIIGDQYVQSVIKLAELLPKEGIAVDSFIFPPMTCQGQEYTAEKIFADEIANSESDEFRGKKKEIQERFRRGEIDIDESLELLEEIKRDEFDAREELRTTQPDRIEWAMVDKEIECDFVVVASDITVVTSKDLGGAHMKFDTRRDITEQIHQFKAAQASGKVPELREVRYIDLRIAQRIYFTTK